MIGEFKEIGEFKDGEAVKSLHETTRPFATEDLTKSWWFTGSTIVLLAIVLTSAALVSWWPARLGLSILGGLLMVRAFVLYHDFMHGAILRKSRIGMWIYHLYGLISLTPPHSWRHSHNFHHANVGKPIPAQEGQVSLLTSDIGAVPLMTTEMWRQTSFWERFRYRLSRHPLTILFAYVTVFLYSICLQPLLSNPRKYLGWGGFITGAWLDHRYSLGVRRLSGSVFRIYPPLRHCRRAGRLFVFCATQFSQYENLADRGMVAFSGSVGIVKLFEVGSRYELVFGEHRIPSRAPSQFENSVLSITGSDAGDSRASTRDRDHAVAWQHHRLLQP